MDDKQIIKKFGLILKSLREQRGLSQEALAHAINSHATHISRLENGHKQPTLTTIFKIASVLKIEPIDMIKTLQDSLKK
ncbi:helix-turn-helix transcriptional regulator [Reichenbachiella sp.]|uniref:helix-turn-helix domain-containing protein n=1 Tax=Reichenbachiella sp. TaxID=2184521 RepID=UPI003297C287